MGRGDEIRTAVKWAAPSVDLSATLRAALTSMANSGVSALVVKSGAEVVGVVTDMDFMGSIANGDDLDTVTVSTFMSSCEVITDKQIKTPCVQLDETQSVANAIGVMNIAGVHHLLVTGDQGAGIVSARDLLRLVIQ